MRLEEGVTATQPPEAALRRFAAALRGRLILPADPEYETSRQVWNGMIDRRPAIIARCATTEDVVEAVRFAREHELLVAVRGGGHNVAGLGVCDGGLVIDLSAMKQIRVDPGRRTAMAQPGLTWGEFDAATQAHGLATTGGIQSSTGIAGLTLGGGFGYLARKHGLTCDNLLSAEVVTAEGRVVRASGTENEDLFWGLRGGGGNFGVVTAFEYRLHPIGPSVVGGMIVYPFSRAPAVLEFYREYITTVPEELFTLLAFVTAPAAPQLPTELHGQPILAVLACYAGPPDEAEKVLQPLRAFGPPAADLVGLKPYTVIQTLLDAGNPPGWLNYWKSEYVRGLDTAILGALFEHAALQPSAMCKILVPHLGGAISRLPMEATPYPHRQAPLLVNAIAMWSDAERSDEHIHWAREAWTAMQPFSTGGAYVNFLNEEGGSRIRAAYGPNYDRLAALKRRYDPDNFFRVNQNIAPA